MTRPLTSPVAPLDWSTPQTIEISSGGFDPRAGGLGSSGAAGEMSSYGIRVPAWRPHNEGERDPRWFFRFCGANVPRDAFLRLHGFRPYVEIGQVVEIEAIGELGRARYPVLLEQTSPRWAFSDGNVVFHVVWIPGNPRIVGGGPSPRHDRSFVNDPFGLSPGILYRPGSTPPGAAADPYYPMWNAVPPGDPVGSLGSVYNVIERPLDVVFNGPGQLAVYGSVLQTDPNTRPALDPDELEDLQIATMGPEDRFVLAWTEAIYTRIGASILVDIGPRVRRWFMPEAPDLREAAATNQRPEETP